MTQLLRTYLQLALEEPGRRSLERIVETIPRELGTVYDGKVEPVRELLLSTKIESTTLLQTEMFNTIKEGAQPAICFRNAVEILPMDDNQLTVPIGEGGAYAAEVAEGAEVPIRNEDFTTVTYTAHKDAERPLITNEMIADCKYPLIERAVKRAGRALENKLNQRMLTEMLDSAGNEHDTAGTNQGITAIADAIALVKDDGWIPDSIILSSRAEAALLKQYVPTGYTGSDAAQSGRLPSLLGLRPFSTTVTDASSTYTWGYAADGNIGMLVYDSSVCGGIGMRQDIQIEEYSDPIRGMKSMVATARWAVGTEQADAICRIEY